MFLFAEGETYLNTNCVPSVYYITISCGSAVVIQQIRPVVVAGSVPSISNIHFGNSVDINDNFLVVGAPNASKFLRVMMCIVVTAFSLAMIHVVFCCLPLRNTLRYEMRELQTLIVICMFWQFGCYFSDDRNGAVYVYELFSPIWQLVNLIGSPPRNGSASYLALGQAVSLAGTIDYLQIGAPGYGKLFSRCVVRWKSKTITF